MTLNPLENSLLFEALKERESLAEHSMRFEVHPNMISNWKKEFMEKCFIGI